MYLFYVDESGDPDGWQDQNNFVLAGVAVHEGQIRHFSEELDAIQARFFPTISVPIELHASHIRAGKGTRFRSLTDEQRNQLMPAVYDVFA